MEKWSLLSELNLYNLMEFTTIEEKNKAVVAAEKVVAESEGEAKEKAEKVLEETKEGTVLE